MSTFPETRQTLLGALHSGDAHERERARDLVAGVYRAPIVALCRHRWGLQAADAEDLAHDFLLQAFSKDWFGRYDAHRGRFRTFVRSCLWAFASTRTEASGRLKRGGGATHVPLDTLEIAAPADAELDALFDREWVRSVLDHALVSLHARAESEGRTAALAVFRARDLEVADGDTPPTYAALATTFGIPPTQVTNHLNWARRAFRSEVLTTLRSLTTSEDDFRSEARALLGVDAA